LTPPIHEDDLRRAFSLDAFDPALAQRPMTPSVRGVPLVDASGPLREAAALLYAFRDDDRLRFPLTLRREDLREHRGQVSLPGGRPEPGEAPWQTAEREAREEIGVLAHRAERVGALSAVTIPPTHTRLVVHVCIGPDPRPFVVAEREVARVVLADLDDLVDESRRSRCVRTVDGRALDVPAFAIGDLEVWGATAMALSELAERLRAARAR
jgi:8-oxo-dGTP pyrophosphatase MutT (NUDIX family)